jgi:DNA polymerase-3 subunit epsilon
MTADLPRSPGVYMFRGQRDEILYVGKATNLRQRVRSYFGSDDRRKIGPMLRETQSVAHLDLPDALTAEVIESRLISRLLPRYNRAGTRVDKYCYVKLDIDSAWPRLSVVKNPGAKGLHLGPLPSRTMANLVIEAIQTAVPLRRCTVRMGRGYTPAADAAVCSAAQLGVALCPCSGTADPAAYARAVDAAASALVGDPRLVVERLRDRMLELAAAQRFEEAAATRDRTSALLGAVRRHLLVDALCTAERAEVTYGESTWIIDRGRLIDATRTGQVGRALPVPPPEPGVAAVLSREQIDEALCLARFCDKRAERLAVRCSGSWTFPIGDRLPDLATLVTRAA